MQPYKALMGLGIGLALAGALACGRSTNSYRHVDKAEREEMARDRAKYIMDMERGRIGECTVTFNQNLSGYSGDVRKANSKLRKAGDIKPGTRVKLPEMEMPMTGYNPETVTVNSAEEIDRLVFDRAREATREEENCGTFRLPIEIPSVFPR